MQHSSSQKLIKSRKIGEIESEQSSEYEDVISSEEEFKKKDERLWTRVWNSASESGSEISVFNVNEDLRRVSKLSQKKSITTQVEGTLIWSPTTFPKDVKQYDLEEVRLSEEELC